MPRGGHFGLLQPTPKDIFRSRWKRFYKRCYRLRNRGNQPDRSGPHRQPTYNPDAVPSPWKLLYSADNFDQNFLPPDVRPARIHHYRNNARTFMRPMDECKDVFARDAVLRSLDPGRRGGACSGLGRAEMAPWKNTLPEHMPAHIYNVIKEAHEGHGNADAESQDFLELLLSQTPETQMRSFPIRRIQALVEEWEIVWEDGQNNQRARKTTEDTKEVDRGRFPYIDEQAGLLDSLDLKEILRLSHRTKSRRHPKWREISYAFKKDHRQYLRRRDMNLDETKARMGVIRQALLDA